MVSAVLGAMGKRYLVETGESEDGNQTWERYSDGYKVCTIKGYWAGPKYHDITFPLEFEKIPIVLDSPIVDSKSSVQFYNSAFDITTTGFRMNGTNADHCYVAFGY